MATVKISGLPVAASATGADLFAIVQGGVTKQLTNTLLFTSPTLITPALGTPTSGDLANCTGYLISNLTGVLPIVNGGTGASTAGTALTNLGGTATGTALFTAANAATGRATLSAAVSGANNDITSLTGLTTPLSVAQGGTSATALTANNVLLGNGTSAPLVVAPGTSGNLLSSNGTTWVSSTPTASVTAVTGTAPVVSSGGTAPAISMAAATTAVNGYLTSTDWTTFNNKAGSGANSNITSLSGLTTPLSVAQGGTGLTAAGTSGYVVTSTGTAFVMAPAPGASGSVSSFSAGTTGFTPSTATTGVITLAGTLGVANGGTGLISPGTSGYLLSSSGTGFIPLATVPVANGGTGQTTIAGIRNAYGVGVAVTKTAAYTAVAGDVLACDTIASGAFSITLPATPTAGDKPIVIFDAGTTDVVNGFATNNLTVLRNGSTVHTLAQDVTFSTKGVCVTFEYVAGTWRLEIGR